MKHIWYYTIHGDDYPLGFFSSRSKVLAEIRRITANNAQKALCRYDVKRADVK